MSNRSLLDQLVDAEAVYKQAKAAYEALQEAVEAEYNMGLHEGTERNVHVYLSQRSITDFEKMERLYGVTAEQFKLYSACKMDGNTFTVVKVIDKKKKKGE